MSARNRDWESAVASNPIAHRFVKKPLSHLRRKTESLLSEITGASVSNDEQIQDRELGKRLTCRHCGVRFHDEVALSTHFNLLPDHREGHDVRRSPTKQRSQSSMQPQSPILPFHERSTSNASSSFHPSSPHQRERSDSSGRVFSSSPSSSSFAFPASNSRGLHSRKSSFAGTDDLAASESRNGSTRTSPTVSTVRESRNIEAGKASAALAAQKREALRSKQEQGKAPVGQRQKRSGSESAVEALSEIRSQLPAAIFPGLASPTSKNKFKKVQDAPVLNDNEQGEEGKVDGSSRFSTLPRSTASSRPPVPPRASTMKMDDADGSSFSPLFYSESASSKTPTASASSRRQPPPPPPGVPRRSTNPFITSQTDPSGSFAGGRFDVDLSAISLNDHTGVEHEVPSPVLTSPISGSNPFRKHMPPSSPSHSSSNPYLSSGSIPKEESESQPLNVDSSLAPSTSVSFPKSISQPVTAYCPNCSQGFATARMVIVHLDMMVCQEENDDERL